MRKSLVVLAVLFALAVVAPAGAEGAHPQKPGKWQIKLQMEMPNMPVKMPPFTWEVCLTEEDLKDPQKAVPNDPKSKCEVSDYEVNGNKVTWSIECKQQNMKGTGEITFSDDSYTGKMDMTVGDQSMTTKYSGKWLGECTK